MIDKTMRLSAALLSNADNLLCESIFHIGDESYLLEVGSQSYDPGLHHTSCAEDFMTVSASASLADADIRFMTIQ